MHGQRRDKGDGSVYQRKDGLWVAQITPAPGAKDKYFYGKTETEVKRKLREFKKEIARNDFFEIQKITVGEYMDNWLRTVKVNNLKPKSYDRQEVTLKNQVYRYIGDIQMGTLTVGDVQGMINGLVSEGLSYSTIKKAYNAVNGCFKLALIKGDVVKNPCLGVSLPKNLERQKSDIRFFSDDEIDLICRESVAGYGNGKQIYRLGYAVIVLMYTGMRIGELLGLRWADVDFDKRLITVKGSFVAVRNRDKDAAVKNVLLYQNSVKTKAG